MKRRIDQFDQWLIAGLYQRLVDVSQKTPAWWVEQCAFLLLLSGLGIAFWPLSGALRYFMAVCTVLGAAYTFMESRMPMLLEASARLHGPRKASMVTTLLLLIPQVLFLVLAGRVSELCWMAYGISVTSSCYFAACKPPRPREPRTKLQPEGA